MLLQQNTYTKILNFETLWKVHLTYGGSLAEYKTSSWTKFQLSGGNTMQTICVFESSPDIFAGFNGSTRTQFEA